MENKKSGHISEKELDNLLNEAFLNLDFESNSKNKEVLAIVTKQAMHKNSIYSFFISRRFNFLFLLLSLLIFLSSFYRYIDPLLSEENKKTNTVPQTRIVGKTPQFISLIKKSSGKSISGNFYEHTSVSAKTVNTYPAKIKDQTATKKNEIRTISEALSLKETVDSASKAIEPVSVIKSEQPFYNISKVDSLNNVSQKSLFTAGSISKVKEEKSSKKIKPTKSDAKVKVGKRRRGRLFGRATKVRKKGSRFLKDSGRR